MTFASTDPRSFSPILAVLAGLVCVQGACSLRSLDYLKNGHRQDGAARDSGGIPSSPDAASFDAVHSDALASDGASGIDGSGGANLDSGMANDRTDSGAVDGMAVDGHTDVSSGGTAEAGRDIPEPTETDSFSLDGTGETGPMDTPPRIDSVSVDSSNPDVVNLDALLADDVSSDSSIPDSSIPDSSIPDSLHPDGFIPDTPPPRPAALFVVGAIPLPAADTIIQARLTVKGYDVTLVKDSNLASITSVTAAVVVISSTVTPGNVTTKFRNTATPIMVYAPSLFANMGFVDGSLLSQGSTLLTFSSLDVNSTAGELAAGLSGTVAVLQAATNMGYGVPNSRAVAVATIPNSSTACGIFAYDAGAQMYNVVAPARRVGFALAANNTVALTADGWWLFDAALAWLAK
jgi:hypothetical protein